MVLYSRHNLFAPGRWPGLFSELHSALGALWYSRTHGALGLRIHFDAPNYLDPDHGDNWWRYYFEPDTAWFGPLPKPPVPEVHLTGAIARYGKYWGFGHLVYGSTPFLYPKTYGLPRGSLADLVRQHVHVRPEIRQRVESFVQQHFAPASFVVGVHYRGTDTARHYPYYHVAYEAFALEVERVLPPGVDTRVFVATDEQAFLDFAQRTWPGRALCWAESPRVRREEPALHLNTSLGVSNYQKGESALIDCLLLAACSYLVKGRSNLSDAALVFNPSLPYSFCVC